MNKENPQTQACPECGGEMRHEKRPEQLEYLGHQRACMTLSWWCSQCGEAILDGAALRASETAFLELKAEVEGVLGPADVAAARTRLGLSQRKAGELLGGGPRAFQKYESGKQSVSVPMSRLLTLLAKDPRRLQELPGAPRPSKAARKGG